MSPEAPLPGGPRPLPHQAQARGCLRAMAALGVAALLAAPFGEVGRGLAIVVAIQAFFLGLMAFGITLLGRSWARQLRHMERGEYLLHWRYSPAEWAPYRQHMQQETRRIHWILTPALAVSGVIFAILLHSDGNPIAGSLLLNYLIPLVAGAALGWLLAAGIAWFNTVSLRLMDREPPEAVLGPEGFYITGQYWPWRSVGQHLTHAALGDGDPPTLDFHFHVSTGRGSTTRVVAIPVPAGGRVQAEQWVARFRDGLSSRD